MAKHDHVNLAEFMEHDVFDPAHPTYSAVKEEIVTVQKLPGVWFQGIF